MFTRWPQNRYRVGACAESLESWSSPRLRPYGRPDRPQHRSSSPSSAPADRRAAMTSSSSCGTPRPRRLTSRAGGCRAALPERRGTRATVRRCPPTSRWRSARRTCSPNNAAAGYSGATEPDRTYGTGFTDFAATNNFAGIRIVNLGEHGDRRRRVPEQPVPRGHGHHHAGHATATTRSSASAARRTPTTTPPTSRARSPEIRRTSNRPGRPIRLRRSPVPTRATATPT